MNVDHVTARIRGEERMLKIERGDLPIFEQATDAPAFATLNSLSAGRWTVAQLRDVLRFAFLSPKELERVRSLCSAVPGVAASVMRSKAIGVDTSHVDGLLAKQPPAVYAPLAIMILSAALFGLPADEATFTDEAADAAA